MLVRLAQALLTLLLLWRQPVPALWVLLIPLLLLPLARRWWAGLVALLPTLALAGLGASAWYRGAVGGLWLSAWELVLLAVALGLAFLGLGGRASSGRSRKAKAAGKGKGR